eukprot:228299_1
MSTTQKTKEMHPLLTTDSVPSDSKLRKKQLFVVSIILIATIAIITIAIIITYIEGAWPFNKSKSSITNIYGKYPVFGGNIKNQQIALNSRITEDNIAEIELRCIYIGVDNSVTGYITVDNDNNGYFGGGEYLTSVNLDTCVMRWNISFTDIFNTSFAGILGINTPTLYKTSNGKQALLFGTMNCHAVSLDMMDGSVIWKTNLSQGRHSSLCRCHGFMIDKQFAYGGVSSFANAIYPSTNNMFIGRMYKINVHNGEIINIWYTMPLYNDTINYEEDGFYSGASVWPISAVIDNYVVFGTGNLFTYPRKTEQCMLGNVSCIPIESVYEYNLCAQDMRETSLNWRCLEKNIYTDSLIILNKHSFKLEAAIPVAGVDTWYPFCVFLYFQNQTEFYQIPDCPKRLPPAAAVDMTSFGPDADLVAIATYHDDSGQAYVAAGQKSGQFYVMEIPSGNVKIMKKVGPWSTSGGTNPFSMAVDEENMIAIYSIVGQKGFEYSSNDIIKYSYKMGDGTVVCDAGAVHAIDLNTGYTIWQWINPYAKLNEECNSTLYNEYFDMTVDGTCERAFDGTDMLSPNESVINVVTPPIDNVIIPMDIDRRLDLNGPIQINNNMVFISTQSGDIFIHNITNGEYINRLQCPDYFVDENWNRAGIRSGISIFEDRIVFYCGSNFGRFNPSSTLGNQMISMKLPSYA